MLQQYCLWAYTKHMWMNEWSQNVKTASVLQVYYSTVYNSQAKVLVSLQMGEEIIVFIKNKEWSLVHDNLGDYLYRDMRREMTQAQSKSQQGTGLGVENLYSYSLGYWKDGGMEKRWPMGVSFQLARSKKIVYAIGQ